MRYISKSHVYECDICGGVSTERIFTAIDEDSPSGPISDVEFRTVRFKKTHRHYCDSCWLFRFETDSFMAESYLEAVRREIPLPQEVVNWFFDYADELSTDGEGNGTGRTMQKFGIKLSPWYYHRYGGGDGKGWRNNEPASFSSEIRIDVPVSTPSVATEVDGPVNTVEVFTAEQAFRFRVPGPITHVRALWKDSLVG